MITSKGVQLPDDLADALATNLTLKHVLDRMRPSCQRGYVDWINDADSPEKRAQRIERVLGKVSRWGERHHLVEQDSENQAHGDQISSDNQLIL